MKLWPADPSKDNSSDTTVTDNNTSDVTKSDSTKTNNALADTNVTADHGKTIDVVTSSTTAAVTVSADSTKTEPMTRKAYKAQQATANKLPQTGNQSSLKVALVGGLMVVLSLFGFGYKKRH